MPGSRAGASSPAASQTRNADVRTEVEGLVAEVSVREGMKVQQGDLVARLSDRDVTAELRKTEAELAEKQATLRMLRVGPRPEEIAVAREEIAKWKQCDYLIISTTIAEDLRRMQAILEAEKMRPGRAQPPEI